MALIFTACASHHRDVASLNDNQDNNPATEQAQHAQYDRGRGGEAIR